MTDKRRGLGRGIGALIPSGPGAAAAPARPRDLFFSPSASSGEDPDGAPGPRGQSAAQDAARALMAPSSRAMAKSARRATAPAVPADRVPDSAPTGEVPPRTDAKAPAPASAPVPDSDDYRTEDGGPGDMSQQAPAALADATAGPLAAEDDLVPVPGATFAELAIDAIVRNARQPRQVFDEEELDELAASIREVGVLQPVVVRPLTAPNADAPEARYELIMGERRWRASRQAGLTAVPAIIRDTEDGDLLRDALLENLHRAQLNPLEEAAAYQQLLEDFGCTHDELASRVARSRPQISNTLRLLKLPALVQRRVAAGVLSAGHARALLGLSDGAAMERLAQKIVAEGLSVRATEEIVALGDEPVAPEMRRRPRPSDHAEALNRLATRLADRLDTRVKVNMGQRKGRIAIDFATVEDLNRILDVLAPGETVPASEN